MLKKNEVAKLFAVSTQTVMRWAREGLLPHIRVRGMIRFRQSDVAAFVEADLRQQGVSQ